MELSAGVKSKKKSKVDPVETELNDLGAPPSTDDLQDLFGLPGAVQNNEDRPESSNAAFTEDTMLGDSTATSKVGLQDKDSDEQTSSRSSTPTSASGMTKKVRRNMVAPIHEETSFGMDNETYEEDTAISIPVIEAWSEAESEHTNRPNTAPSNGRYPSDTNLSRPSTAPSNRGGFLRSNKVTPTSTRASSPQLSERTSSPVMDDKVENKIDGEFTSKSPKTSEVERPSVTSMKSLQSRKSEAKFDAWTIEEKKNDEKIDLPEKDDSDEVVQEESRALVAVEAVLAPPVSTGEHQAYVPLDYAKDCIQRVIEDMKKMKANHYKVVEKIQEQYQLIEEESQAKFNDYVLKLRGEYNSKAATFRHVIESHQNDFTKKQKFYEEAIKSVRDKNKSLLFEKRQLLVKAKESNVKHKKEKDGIMEDLIKMLNTKHKEYIILREKYEEKRESKEKVDDENLKLNKELKTLKELLQKSSGDNEKVYLNVNTLTDENSELKRKLDEVETEKLQLNESFTERNSQVSEKDQLLQESKDDMEAKEVSIKEKDEMLEENSSKINELQQKIEELTKALEEAKYDIPSAANVQVETEVVKDKTEEENTQEQIVENEDANEKETVKERKASVSVTAAVDSDALEKYEKQSTKLKESTEKVEALEKEMEELKKDMQEVKNEKNITKMELINIQEKNSILHTRLETMLNEVADTVNVDQTKIKLDDLHEKKLSLQNEIDEIKKQIDEWRVNYKNEHDGEEPTEENRPENIQELFNDLKAKDENMKFLDKDILVLNMLLDGTLPDDMKQQENADNTKDNALEELRKEHADEKSHLNDLIQMLKERTEVLNKEKEELEIKLKEKKEVIVEKLVEVEKNNEDEKKDDETKEAIEVQHTGDTFDESVNEKLNELTEALKNAEKNLLDLEKEKDVEIESLKKSSHKIEKKAIKLQTSNEKLEEEKRELKSQIKIAKDSSEADINLKQETIDQLKKEVDELNEAKLSKLPVKAKTEIKALQEKLKEAESNKTNGQEETLQLQSKINELNEQVNNLNVANNALKEKEAELKALKETEKKYKELKKKYKSLEAKKVVTKTVTTPSVAGSTGGGEDGKEIKKLQKKIAELEKQLQDDPTSLSKETPSKKDSKTDPKALLKLEKSNEILKEKVEGLKKSAQGDADRIKELEQKVKEAKSKGDDKNSKKQEKTMKDLQKKYESEQKKTSKYKEELEKEKAETERLTKELDSADSDRSHLKDEINKLGVAAQEGIEAAEKVKELSKSNKHLTEENKNLAENFNSERILRKKYYNMVEDMKGKIRVYCRARPLSRSELERGNHNIIASPDEYSLIVQTARGAKDFQYDAVFTPDMSQEKVFEDTNALIQSAVDGYNVCIFAYGQTGSGKTFTMIGDKEQKFPGVAPRAFDAIYQLIDENKSKFSFKTYMYMLELYRDNLIDLFGDTKHPAKLDIKKDKKGMVQVGGSVVKEARDSKELMSIFESGSANRHVASTKMNSESSRSHLVLSIVIESTNLTSGAVVRGKLSLVDLAGSERANKTGATAEQLKEAQSINKSLSALGDVISALSSEQSFIPYRNNKLTLLMQDSLGGNAKTLMFVNISPADYNADETVTSLTYASRVKLITNDASKNSDNKEIARLKGIISKLKKGESVDDDDD